MLVGTAAAERLLPGRAALALVVALGLQVGVNLANDYFDARGGIDTERRVGPRRMTAMGLIAPARMRAAIWIVLAIAAAAGAFLALLVGPELLGVGVLCLAGALGYSGGSRPYASRALGELAVFFFFGLVATMGSAYVQDEQLTLVSLTASIPVGLLATALLVVNNLRDIDTDRVSGKITLAVRLGARHTRTFYGFLVAGGCLGPVLVAAALRDWRPVVATWPLLVVARPLGLVRSGEPRALVQALGATSFLQLAVGSTLAAMLWIS